MPEISFVMTRSCPSETGHWSDSKNFPTVDRRFAFEVFPEYPSFFPRGLSFAAMSVKASTCLTRLVDAVASCELGIGNRRASDSSTFLRAGYLSDDDIFPW